MARPVQLEPSYVIHSRYYRNTSVILDLFTQHHGIISLVARGVRSERSRTKGLLQPFMPLLVTWGGRGELYTLYSVEPAAGLFGLQGQALLSGFYLNELLLRLLHRHDPHPQLFLNYQATLTRLQQSQHCEIALRIFEKQLLEELGYGLQLHCEAQTGAPILLETFYHYYPETGFMRLQAEPNENLGKFIFSGNSLLSIYAETMDSLPVLRDAKRLMRLAFAPLLAGKPLKSRELFV